MKLVAVVCTLVIFINAIIWQPFNAAPPRLHSLQLEGFTSLTALTSTPIPHSKLKRCIVTYGNYRKYLQALAYYLVPQKRRGDFDEWVVFKSSSDPLDTHYLESLTVIHNPWIKIYKGKSSTSTLVDLCNFTADPNTVYLKLDHTVLWIQDDFVRKLFETRLQDPSPFLVLPNVVNSSDSQTHLSFLADLDKYSIINWHSSKPPQIFTQDYQTMSIPAAAYFGRDLEDVQLAPDADVETFLTVDFPKKHKRPHLILALPLCANYGIDAEDVLKGYLRYLRARVVIDASASK